MEDKEKIEQLKAMVAELLAAMRGDSIIIDVPDTTYSDALVAARDYFATSKKTFREVVRAFSAGAAVIADDDLNTWLDVAVELLDRYAGIGSLDAHPAGDLEWLAYFNQAVYMARRYEDESGRTHGLTFAEMCRCLAAAGKLHILDGAREIPSTTGDPLCASLGVVWAQVIGLLNQTASYYGCRRGPIVPWDKGGEVPGGISTPGD